MVPFTRILLAAGFAATCGGASAADYSRYRMIDNTPLDMMAGPANTAALLSPDGSRLLHIGTQICLLAPTPAGSEPWTRIGCIKNSPDYGLRAPEDMLWSPRGDRLLMPSYTMGMQMFLDTDVRLFDPQAMTIANLTDDGVDDDLLSNKKPADFDIIARWLDGDSIAFLRYRLTGEGFGSGGPPSVMKIAAAGGEPSVLVTIAGADRFLAYTLAVSSDGKRIAYGYDDRNNPGIAGIYVLDVGTGAVERVAGMADVGQPPVGMAFSADAKFLLLLGQSTTNTGLDARVLDLATGKVVQTDAGRNVTGVAWSPTGSALAYVTLDSTNPDDPGGLFLADRPGEPGRQLLKGAFMAPVCCGNLPFTWASNDTMVIGNAAEHTKPLFVRLGE